MSVGQHEALRCGASLRAIAECRRHGRASLPFTRPTASPSGTTSRPSRRRNEKKAAYDALFKVATFSTVFGYAGIDVVGDTAVVRTFHHRGATVVEGGKDVVDLNREVFVLHKIGGAWKISLYIFNTDPVQGEG